VLSQAGLTPASSTSSIGAPIADDRLSDLARLAGMAPEGLSVRGDEIIVEDVRHETPSTR
jgi:hypothetical protein